MTVAVEKAHVKQEGGQHRTNTNKNEKWLRPCHPPLALDLALHCNRGNSGSCSCSNGSGSGNRVKQPHDASAEYSRGMENEQTLMAKSSKHQQNASEIDLIAY